MSNLNDSDFEIFGLHPGFALDEKLLSQTYLNLQSQTHPDRFASGTAQEKRVAVQWATRLNEAYKRLQNPTERAIYWCELKGQDPRGRQSNLPPALLMQQMEWRETLEETEDLDSLEDLLDEVIAQKKASLNKIASEIDEQQDAIAATQTCQGLLFIEKFLVEVKKRIEILEDAS